MLCPECGYRQAEPIGYGGRLTTCTPCAQREERSRKELVIWSREAREEYERDMAMDPDDLTRGRWG